MGVPDCTEVAASAEDDLIARENQKLVLDALAVMADDRRPVFVLHEIDGVAVPEIAHALGLNLDTTYSRLRRAKEEFRAAVLRISARKGVRR